MSHEKFIGGILAGTTQAQTNKHTRNQRAGVAQSLNFAKGALNHVFSPTEGNLVGNSTDKPKNYSN